MLEIRSRHADEAIEDVYGARLPLRAEGVVLYDFGAELVAGAAEKEATSLVLVLIILVLFLAFGVTRVGR